MSRIALALAVGLTAIIAATPAMSAWTAKETDDGQGTFYFLATGTGDGGRTELFCNADGVFNLSLIWPDRAHPDAADIGEPASVTISTDAGAEFRANSYYWASGRGVLILDFGNPFIVRDIATAIGDASASVTMSVKDEANGIEKTIALDTDGASEAMAQFLDWCPPAE